LSKILGFFGISSPSLKRFVTLETFLWPSTLPQKPAILRKKGREDSKIFFWSCPHFRVTTFLYERYTKSLSDGHSGFLVYFMQVCDGYDAVVSVFSVVQTVDLFIFSWFNLAYIRTHGWTLLLKGIKCPLNQQEKRNPAWNLTNLILSSNLWTSQYWN